MTRILQITIAAVTCAAAIVFSASQTTADQPSLYGPWPNGPPQDPDFFPLAVWWQSPTGTGHSGPYPTQAAAAAAEKINIFLGLNGASGEPESWPERFGQDMDELETIKANKLYVIGGINTPYTQNTSANSVASMLALAKSIGASRNLIGYNAGDEPNCDGGMQLAPQIVGAISSFDPTRVVVYNHTAWVKSPQWDHCVPASVTALRATSIGSFDLYPITDAWLTYEADYTGSDYESIPNDGMFLQGLTTRALVHFGRVGQPMWVCIEAGGDNFGFSEANNVFKGGVVEGSNVLTNNSGWSKFTSSWINLIVSGDGIPKGARILRIVDGGHAVMSASASATAAGETVTVTGGEDNSDCVERVNLCVVNGNEYRPRPAQVNAEVWMSIINGANGIIYFCHDHTSYSFCLGDADGGPAAAAAQANLTYVDETVLKFAPVLNAATVGSCSMQQQNFDTGQAWTTSSCANGIITMASDDQAVPGMVLVKQAGDAVYVFAQSDRASVNGATFTFTLNGLASKTAKLVYDSDDHYDPAHASDGFTAVLDASGQFKDRIGANRSDYQVKIYKIQ